MLKISVFAQTELAQPLNTTDNYLFVKDSHRFVDLIEQNNDFEYVLIYKKTQNSFIYEIVKVIFRDKESNRWVVERGQSNSLPRFWPKKTFVVAGLLPIHFEYLVNNIISRFKNKINKINEFHLIQPYFYNIQSSVFLISNFLKNTNYFFRLDKLLGNKYDLYSTEYNQNVTVVKNIFVQRNSVGIGSVESYSTNDSCMFLFYREACLISTFLKIPSKINTIYNNYKNGSSTLYEYHLVNFIYDGSVCLNAFYVPSNFSVILGRGGDVYSGSVVIGGGQSYYLGLSTIIGSLIGDSNTYNSENNELVLSKTKHNVLSTFSNVFIGSNYYYNKAIPALRSIVFLQGSTGQFNGLVGLNANTLYTSDFLDIEKPKYFGIKSVFCTPPIEFANVPLESTFNPSTALFGEQFRTANNKIRFAYRNVNVLSIRHGKALLDPNRVNFVDAPFYLHSEEHNRVTTIFQFKIPNEFVGFVLYKTFFYLGKKESFSGDVIVSLKFNINNQVSYIFNNVNLTNLSVEHVFEINHSIIFIPSGAGIWLECSPFVDQGRFLGYFSYVGQFLG